MRVVSFYAGCGGLDLGFEQAGFQVVWANEFDSAVRNTYLKNHPRTEFVLDDIVRISPDAIPDSDGFIGGPPCQSWSVAGKQRGLDDMRGKLFLTYIDLIKVKKPKFFLIENVKGLLDDKFKDAFQDFLNLLDSAGYDVNWQLLDAINYGVPQNRERVFLIGFRKDLNIKYTFPLPTCREPISLYRAIGDIKEDPVRYRGGDTVGVNLKRSNHDVLISDFGPFYYRGNRRRGWQQPSFTIHATADNIPLHPSSPKMMFFGHENWDFQKDNQSSYRRLSVRECARIQTFPDSFTFDCDDITATYRMIGNAVPPRLGRVLAKSILSVFAGEYQTEADTCQLKTVKNACTLVGYYKNDSHHDLILRNLLYYVRSDGRKGSIFKEDCEMMPEFLLMHHSGNAELLELEPEEPVLAYGSSLKKLGFDCHGDVYLCFKLKNGKRLRIEDMGGTIKLPVYDKNNYIGSPVNSCVYPYIIDSL